MNAASLGIYTHVRYMIIRSTIALLTALGAAVGYLCLLEAVFFKVVVAFLFKLRLFSGFNSTLPAGSQFLVLSDQLQGAAFFLPHAIAVFYSVIGILVFCSKGDMCSKHIPATYK